VKETPQQYTQRILSYIEGKEPLAVQAATADKLAQLIERVSAFGLRRCASPKLRPNAQRRSNGMLLILGLFERVIFSVGTGATTTFLISSLT